VVEPLPPIFVADRGDLDVFRSVEDMLAYVEPWDVSESLQVFDAHGQRLALKAEGVKRTRFTVGGGRTLLDRGTPEEHVPEVLAAILRDYVRQVGTSHFGWDDEDLRTASLEDLVSAVAEHFGRS